MRLEFNEDQTTFLTFLGLMLDSPDAGFRTVADWGRFDYGAALDARLAENGFFEAAAEKELGAVAAATMIHEIAQSPVTLECGASALLRPFLGNDLPRPVAVVVDDAPGAVRFLPVARTLVSINQAGVRIAQPEADAVEAVESLYAYPMGRIDMKAQDWVPATVDPARARALWQVAVAAELAGTLKGGLKSVLAHVRDRHQFGRPIGSFQAVQHRLAINGIEIEAARMQMLKAAQTLLPHDSCLALGYAQGLARRAIYDFHQFMGAMGLTLEHPLHRWTYRARLLRAEMGGPSEAYGRYATQRWGAA